VEHIKNPRGKNTESGGIKLPHQKNKSSLQSITLKFYKKLKDSLKFLT
jgi:hypothetical protein